MRKSFGLISGLMSLVLSGCAVSEAERQKVIEEYEIVQHLRNSGSMVVKQPRDDFVRPVRSEPEVTVILTRIGDLMVYQIESDRILTPAETKKYVDEFKEREEKKLRGTGECGDPEMAPRYRTNIFGNGVVTFRDCPADMRVSIRYCGGVREINCVNRLKGVADFFVPKYVREQAVEMKDLEVELYAIDEDGNKSIAKLLIVDPKNYELNDE